MGSFPWAGGGRGCRGGGRHELRRHERDVVVARGVIDRERAAVRRRQVRRRGERLFVVFVPQRVGLRPLRCHGRVEDLDLVLGRLGAAFEPVLLHQVREDQLRDPLQRLLDADAGRRHRLVVRRVQLVDLRVDLRDRQRVRQVAFVVLHDQRDLFDADALTLEVVLEVLQRLHVRVEREVLAVGDEHDSVGAFEHELARRVVVDLARHGVELQLRAHAADLAEVEGEKVEEKSAVRLRRQREHLALVVRRQRVVDELQVRRFSAETRPVVDDLRRDLFRRVVEEDHGCAGEGSERVSAVKRVDFVTASRVARGIIPPFVAVPSNPSRGGMLSKRFLTCLAIVALAAPLFADAPGVFAITGGTVHPVSGPEIANGTVVIRDGLIEAVGANVAIPSDATVIDAKGKHVYPGLIDAQTSLGFPSATPAPRRRGGQRQTPTETLPETTPAFVAMREAKLSDDDVETKRATGVTTILTVPAFGIFNGQSVIVDLGEGSMESRVIRSGATQQISFLPRPAWTFPDSLMGVVADIRQTMLDAQQYAAAHAVYDKNPSGFKRPDESAALAALGPVLRRDVPVVFVADSELMMRRVMALAKEFNLRYVISGARQAYKMPANLKSVPLLVSVKWPTPPATKEDRDEQPLRGIRARPLQATWPAVLDKNGALFAP